MAEHDIFSGDPVELDLGFNDLVGEGKKYGDPDALAKAYANIERHVKTLERENALTRAERDALSARPNTSANPEPREPAQPPISDPKPETPPKSFTPGIEDIRSQIKDELRSFTESERAQSNMDAAARKLVELYGSEAKASEMIRKRADELGVSVEWLRDSASKSPSAFYATMGINSGAPAGRVTPSSHNEFVPTGGNGAPIRDFEYFDNLRREDPKTYFTAATQKEMMANARRMGADFYKRT